MGNTLGSAASSGGLSDAEWLAQTPYAIADPRFVANQNLALKDPSNDRLSSDPAQGVPAGVDDDLTSFVDAILGGSRDKVQLDEDSMAPSTLANVIPDRMRTSAYFATLRARAKVLRRMLEALQRSKQSKASGNAADSGDDDGQTGLLAPPVRATVDPEERPVDASFAVLSAGVGTSFAIAEELSEQFPGIVEAAYRNILQMLQSMPLASFAKLQSWQLGAVQAIEAFAERGASSSSEKVRGLSSAVGLLLALQRGCQRDVLEMIRTFLFQGPATDSEAAAALARHLAPAVTSLAAHRVPTELSLPSTKRHVSTFQLRLLGSSPSDRLGAAVATVDGSLVLRDPVRGLWRVANGLGGGAEQPGAVLEDNTDSPAFKTHEHAFLVGVQGRLFHSAGRGNQEGQLLEVDPQSMREQQAVALDLVKKRQGWPAGGDHPVYIVAGGHIVLAVQVGPAQADGRNTLWVEGFDVVAHLDAGRAGAVSPAFTRQLKLQSHVRVRADHMQFYANETVLVALTGVPSLRSSDRSAACDANIFSLATGESIPVEGGAGQPGPDFAFGDPIAYCPRRNVIYSFNAQDGAVSFWANKGGAAAPPSQASDRLASGNILSAVQHPAQAGGDLVARLAGSPRLCGVALLACLDVLGHPFRASSCVGDPEGARISSLRAPPLLVPLIVEPTLECFATLNELIAAGNADFCSKAAAGGDRQELEEAALVVCAATRVLRTHAAALQAHGGAAFANRGPIDAARVLLVKVMNGAATADEELGSRVAQEAADTLAAGLDVFFPSGDAQVALLASLLQEQAKHAQAARAKADAEMGLAAPGQQDGEALVAQLDALSLQAAPEVAEEQEGASAAAGARSRQLLLDAVLARMRSPAQVASLVSRTMREGAPGAGAAAAAGAGESEAKADAEEGEEESKDGLEAPSAPTRQQSASSTSGSLGPLVHSMLVVAEKAALDELAAALAGDEAAIANIQSSAVAPSTVGMVDSFLKSLLLAAKRRLEAGEPVGEGVQDVASAILSTSLRLCRHLQLKMEQFEDLAETKGQLVSDWLARWAPGALLPSLLTALGAEGVASPAALCQLLSPAAVRLLLTLLSALCQLRRPLLLGGVEGRESVVHVREARRSLQESAHPYENNTEETRHIAVEGASSYTITFTDRSETEGGCDWLQFFRRAGHEDPITPPGMHESRCSGRRLPGRGEHPALVIDAPEFWLRWHTDGSVTKWGWEMQVVAHCAKEVRIKADPWIADVTDAASFTAATAVAAFAAGEETLTALSAGRSEVAIGPDGCIPQVVRQWLNHPLFAGGLHDAAAAEESPDPATAAAAAAAEAGALDSKEAEEADAAIEAARASGQLGRVHVMPQDEDTQFLLDMVVERPGTAAGTLPAKMRSHTMWQGTSSRVNRTVYAVAAAAMKHSGLLEEARALAAVEDGAAAPSEGLLAAWKAANKIREKITLQDHELAATLGTRPTGEADDAGTPAASASPAPLPPNTPSLLRQASEGADAADDAGLVAMCARVLDRALLLLCVAAPSNMRGRTKGKRWDAARAAATAKPSGGLADVVSQASSQAAMRDAAEVERRALEAVHEALASGKVAGTPVEHVVQFCTGHGIGHTVNIKQALRRREAVAWRRAEAVRMAARALTDLDYAGARLWVIEAVSQGLRACGGHPLSGLSGCSAAALGASARALRLLLEAQGTLLASELEAERSAQLAAAAKAVGVAAEDAQGGAAPLSRFRSTSDGAGVPLLAGLGGAAASAGAAGASRSGKSLAQGGRNGWLAVFPAGMLLETDMRWVGVMMERSSPIETPTVSPGDRSMLFDTYVRAGADTLDVKDVQLMWQHFAEALGGFVTGVEREAQAPGSLFADLVAQAPRDIRAEELVAALGSDVAGSAQRLVSAMDQDSDSALTRDEFVNGVCRAFIDELYMCKQRRGAAGSPALAPLRAGVQVARPVRRRRIRRRRRRGSLGGDGAGLFDDSSGSESDSSTTSGSSSVGGSVMSGDSDGNPALGPGLRDLFRTSTVESAATQQEAVLSSLEPTEQDDPLTAERKARVALVRAVLGLAAMPYKRADHQMLLGSGIIEALSNLLKGVTDEEVSDLTRTSLQEAGVTQVPEGKLSVAILQTVADSVRYSPLAVHNAARPRALALLRALLVQSVGGDLASGGGEKGASPAAGGAGGLLPPGLAGSSARLAQLVSAHSAAVRSPLVDLLVSQVRSVLAVAAGLPASGGDAATAGAGAGEASGELVRAVNHSDAATVLPSSRFVVLSPADESAVGDGSGRQAGFTSPSVPLKQNFTLGLRVFYPRADQAHAVAPGHVARRGLTRLSAREPAALDGLIFLKGSRGVTARELTNSMPAQYLGMRTVAGGKLEAFLQMGRGEEATIRSDRALRQGQWNSVALRLSGGNRFTLFVHDGTDAKARAGGRAAGGSGAAEVDSKVLFSATSAAPGAMERQLESPHPYGNSRNDFEEVTLPGATRLKITFAEETRTERGCDYLQFFCGRSRRSEDRVGADRYSGGRNGSERNFPGLNGTAPLVIEGDTVTVHFHTDSSITDWGYRMTIRGEMPEVVTEMKRRPDELPCHGPFRFGSTAETADGADEAPMAGVVTDMWVAPTALSDTGVAAKFTRSAAGVATRSLGKLLSRPMEADNRSVMGVISVVRAAAAAGSQEAGEAALSLCRAGGVQSLLRLALHGAAAPLLVAGEGGEAADSARAAATDTPADPASLRVRVAALAALEDLAVATADQDGAAARSAIDAAAREVAGSVGRSGAKSLVDLLMAWAGKVLTRYAGDASRAGGLMAGDVELVVAQRALAVPRRLAESSELMPVVEEALVQALGLASALPARLAHAAAGDAEGAAAAKAAASGAGVVATLPESLRQRVAAVIAAVTILGGEMSTLAPGALVSTEDIPRAVLLGVRLATHTARIVPVDSGDSGEPQLVSLNQLRPVTAQLPSTLACNASNRFGSRLGAAFHEAVEALLPAQGVTAPPELDDLQADTAADPQSVTPVHVVTADVRARLAMAAASLVRAGGGAAAANMTGLLMPLIRAAGEEAQLRTEASPSTAEPERRLLSTNELLLRGGAVVAAILDGPACPPEDAERARAPAAGRRSGTGGGASIGSFLGGLFGRSRGGRQDKAAADKASLRGRRGARQTVLDRELSRIMALEAASATATTQPSSAAAASPFENGALVRLRPGLTRPAAGWQGMDAEQAAALATGTVVAVDTDSANVTVDFGESRRLRLGFAEVMVAPEAMEDEVEVDEVDPLELRSLGAGDEPLRTFRITQQHELPVVQGDTGASGAGPVAAASAGQGEVPATRVLRKARAGLLSRPWGFALGVLRLLAARGAREAVVAVIESWPEDQPLPLGVSAPANTAAGEGAADSGGAEEFVAFVDAIYRVASVAGASAERVLATLRSAVSTTLRGDEAAGLRSTVFALCSEKLSKCADVAAALDAHAPPPGKKVLESKHNYENSVDRRYKIDIPKAKKLTIVFDPQTRTESGCDWVQFYDGAGKAIGGQISGTDGWPGKSGTPPLVIQGSKCEMHFHTDSSVNYWGWRMTVTGETPVAGPPAIPGLPTNEPPPDMGVSSWLMDAAVEAGLDRSMKTALAIGHAMEQVHRFLQARRRAGRMRALELLERLAGLEVAASVPQIADKLGATIELLGELLTAEQTANQGQVTTRFAQRLVTCGVMLASRKKALASPARAAAAGGKKEAGPALPKPAWVGCEPPFPSTGGSGVPLLIIDSPAEADGVVDFVECRVVGSDVGGDGTMEARIYQVDLDGPAVTLTGKATIKVDKTKGRPDRQICPLDKPVPIRKGQYIGLYNAHGSIKTVSANGPQRAVFTRDVSHHTPGERQTSSLHREPARAAKTYGFRGGIRPGASVADVMAARSAKGAALYGEQAVVDMAEGNSSGERLINATATAVTTLQEFQRGEPPVQLLKEPLLQRVRAQARITLETNHPMRSGMWDAAAMVARAATEGGARRQGAAGADAIASLGAVNVEAEGNALVLSAPGASKLTVSSTPETNLPEGFEVRATALPVMGQPQPKSQPCIVASNVTGPQPERARVIESPHPYANSSNVNEMVRIEGASSLQVTFDDRTRTERGCDWMEIYTDAGRTNRVGDRLTGGRHGRNGNWPGMEGRPPLTVPGDTLHFRFVTDGSINDWGYLMRVVPVMEARTADLDSSRVRLELLPTRGGSAAAADRQVQREQLFGARFTVVPQFPSALLDTPEGAAGLRAYALRHSSWRPAHDATLVRWLERRAKARGISQQDTTSVTWERLEVPAPGSGEDGVEDLLRLPRAPGQRQRGGGSGAGAAAGGGGATAAGAADDWGMVPERLLLLQQMNDRLQPVLQLFDPDTVDDPASLSHLVTSSRDILLPAAKLRLWEQALGSTSGAQRRDRLVLSRSRASNHRARGGPDLEARKTIFGQAFRRLHFSDPARFRGTGKLYTVYFKGEQSEDAGGPYRETFEMYADELMSSALSLFVPCANKQTDANLNNDQWVPNPSARSAIEREMYRFLGKLMGYAIRSKNYLALNLPRLFWKRLIRQEPTYDDLFAIDKDTCRNRIDWVRRGGDMSPEDWDAAMVCFYTMTTVDGREVELVPGGMDRQVMWGEREDYARRALQFKLHEFDDQIAEVRRGLSTVVPSGLLGIFTGDEVDTMVCGNPNFDCDLLQRITNYRDCTASDAHIVHFWSALRKMKQADQFLFLRFVWGRSRMPLNEREWARERPMTIQSYNHSTPSAGAPTNHWPLPVSHTCFNSVEVPRYPSEEVMTDRLLIAIRNCMAIDGDEGAESGRMGWEEEEEED